MNQLIRQIRQTHCKQDQSGKGFSQVILLGIIAVLILAGAGGFLVLREKKTLPPEKIVRQELSSEDVVSPSALGNLCSGENGCNEYCKNNFGQCQKYCKQYPGNKLCLKLFKFQLAPVEDASNDTKFRILANIPLELLVNDCACLDRSRPCNCRSYQVAN